MRAWTAPLEFAGEDLFRSCLQGEDVFTSLTLPSTLTRKSSIRRFTSLAPRLFLWN